MYKADEFSKELDKLNVKRIAKKEIPWEKFKEKLVPQIKEMVENLKRLIKSEKDPYEVVRQLVKAYPGRPNELTEIFGNLAFDVGPKEEFNVLAGLILNSFYFADRAMADLVEKNELKRILKVINKAIS